MAVNLAQLDEHRAALTGLLDEMHSTPDRSGFYQLLLRRTAKRETGSGLGLGRIYAESELNLSCMMLAEEVQLRASGSFPARAGGGR